MDWRLILEFLVIVGALAMGACGGGVGLGRGGRCGFARACSWFRRFVTALNPVLGYEKSAAIAKEALVTSRSVYELVLEKNC